MLDVESMSKMMELSIQGSLQALEERDHYVESGLCPSAIENWLGTHTGGASILAPRSIVITCPRAFTVEVSEGASPSPASIEFVRLVCVAVETMSIETGFPVFVRNSFCANKKAWLKSCCFMSSDFDDVLSRLKEMALFLLHSTQQFANNIVILEMVPTEPAFYAFSGMPINKEFRFFSYDGVVQGFQPYWDDEDFEDSDSLDPAWERKLSVLAYLAPSQVKLLLPQVKIVAQKTIGFWSIDFLQSENGSWWFIDMQESSVSDIKTKYYQKLEKVEFYE